jgi:hypothetical protein
LAWVSIFYGIKNEDLSNSLFSVLIVILWLFYGLKLVIQKRQRIDIKPKAKEVNLDDENSVILGGFGEFKEINQQISK